MKVGLFDFQEDARDNLHAKLKIARAYAAVENPQVVSFSAPTGAGKTIVMTALFEDIFFGTPELEAQPDAIILWISDIPELNEQTRLKIESKSDRIRVRQLISIDSSFDEEKLAGGHIYFINTQKLGTDKLLTRRGDGRQHTIWETFTNTAKSAPDKFYVVIDEAHRGMRNGRAVATAQTIIQRFLLGSQEHGLCPMPMVAGISATPRRFEELLSEATHTTVHRVHIKAEDVRESGLLKDRILIHYPETTTQAEMTMLASATSQWKTIGEQWSKYCEHEGETVVKPILVIQVEDGTENTLTRTNLADCLTTIESVIGRRLQNREVVHTFSEIGEQDIAGHKVRRVDASRIEEDERISVVFFKMSLSTGWDCPRAEVMMSFRRAQDHTYIAQLLGRMVRTPLARQIEADAALNDVHLYLPHYDTEAVNTVIEDLKDVENVPPSETGTARELVILNRRQGLEDVFEAIEDLVTYRVNAVRKQSALRRLMGLGRGLNHDQIDGEAQKGVKDLIVGRMSEEIEGLRDSGILADKVKSITGIDLRTIAVEKQTEVLENYGEYTVEAVSADIERLFSQSGRRLGNGLHMEYWKAHEERTATEVKVEVVALTQNLDSMQKLEAFAEHEFYTLYEEHKRSIATLKGEKRRKYYERLRLATPEPQNIAWVLPESIDFNRSPNAPEYDKHLYLEKDGKFRADLGNWEKDVLEIELQDENVVGWLRNLDRKSWSLEIPYRDAGSYKPMFPDLLIVRKDEYGFQFDILEPHDPSRDDNHVKAVGLAEFAEKHWGLFGRIELIRKKRGADGMEHYYRLDMGKVDVRNKILPITSNAQLDQIFDEEGKP
jgi:type III restriction enzyme